MLVNAYRSPSSLNENNLELYRLVNEISRCGCKHIVWVGDFNFPGIDWDNYSSSNKLECEFIDTVLDNFLIQNVTFPTRARGEDCPHVLDLVISNDDFVDKIECLAPLGKSDHVVLNVFIKSYEMPVKRERKLNYDKGDYDALGNYLDIKE